jgi:hypothetical protein
MSTTKKTPARNLNAAQSGKPKATRGGARPGAGRKPRSPDDPPEAWRGGRPVTRGDVRGRSLRVIAATEAEAELWRSKAHDAGIPLEVFLAEIVRDALGSP